MSDLYNVFPEQKQVLGHQVDALPEPLLGLAVTAHPIPVEHPESKLAVNPRPDIRPGLHSLKFFADCQGLESRPMFTPPLYLAAAAMSLEPPSLGDYAIIDELQDAFQRHAQDQGWRRTTWRRRSTSSSAAPPIS